MDAANEQAAPLCGCGEPLPLADVGTQGLTVYHSPCLACYKAEREQGQAAKAKSGRKPGFSHPPETRRRMSTGQREAHERRRRRGGATHGRQ